MPKSKLQGAGMQMICGGAVLLFMSVVAGDIYSFKMVDLTGDGFLAWLYLLIFGSIISFSAYNYLLVKSTPDKVATLGYVNPVIALLLGWGLNNEDVTLQSLLATSLLLTGVIFINTNKNILKKKKRTLRPLPLVSLTSDWRNGVAEVDIPPVEKDTDIVARIWHWLTPARKADAYVEWTKNTVVPDFQDLPGNLGMALYRKNEGNVSHMTFVSYWKDMNAVKKITGKNIENACFYKNEKEMLLEGAKYVKHKTVRK